MANIESVLSQLRAYQSLAEGGISKVKIWMIKAVELAYLQNQLKMQ